MYWLIKGNLKNCKFKLLLHISPPFHSRQISLVLHCSLPITFQWNGIKLVLTSVLYFKKKALYYMYLYKRERVLLTHCGKESRFLWLPVTTMVASFVTKYGECRWDKVVCTRNMFHASAKQRQFEFFFHKFSVSQSAVQLCVYSFIVI
jgi:hypothetical protein